MRCLFYDDGQIDFNFTQAMFKTKRGNNVSLSIFDNKTNPYENGLCGECMIAFRYEKLLFKYWNLDAESYRSLSEDDEKSHLPNSLYKYWEGFKSLYSDTFNKSIGSEYDILYSSGLKRI